MPYPEPSAVPEAVPLPSPLGSLSEEDDSVIPGPWEVSIAHRNCARIYLDWHISNGAVMVSGRIDEEICILTHSFKI